MGAGAFCLGDDLPLEDFFKETLLELFSQVLCDAILAETLDEALHEDFCKPPPRRGFTYQVTLYKQKILAKRLLLKGFSYFQRHPPDVIRQLLTSDALALLRLLIPPSAFIHYWLDYVQSSKTSSLCLQWMSAMTRDDQEKKKLELLPSKMRGFLPISEISNLFIGLVLLRSFSNHINKSQAYPSASWITSLFSFAKGRREVVEDGGSNKRTLVTLQPDIQSSSTCVEPTINSFSIPFSFISHEEAERQIFLTIREQTPLPLDGTAATVENNVNSRRIRAKSGYGKLQGVYLQYLLHATRLIKEKCMSANLKARKAIETLTQYLNDPGKILEKSEHGPYLVDLGTSYKIMQECNVQHRFICKLLAHIRSYGDKEDDWEKKKKENQCSREKEEFERKEFKKDKKQEMRDVEEKKLKGKSEAKENDLHEHLHAQEANEGTLGKEPPPILAPQTRWHVRKQTEKVSTVLTYSSPFKNSAMPQIDKGTGECSDDLLRLIYSFLYNENWNGLLAFCFPKDAALTSIIPKKYRKNEHDRTEMFYQNDCLPLRGDCWCCPHTLIISNGAKLIPGKSEYGGLCQSGKHPHNFFFASTEGYLAFKRDSFHWFKSLAALCDESPVLYHILNIERSSLSQYLIWPQSQVSTKESIKPSQFLEDVKHSIPVPQDPPILDYFNAQMQAFEYSSKETIWNDVHAPPLIRTFNGNNFLSSTSSPQVAAASETVNRETDIESIAVDTVALNVPQMEATNGIPSIPGYHSLVCSMSNSIFHLNTNSKSPRAQVSPLTRDLWELRKDALCSASLLLKKSKATQSEESAGHKEKTTQAGFATLG